MEIIKLGDRLKIPGKNIKGEVAYIGKTHFADGTWFGLILDEPIGKHNGTVENKRYFKCRKNHGMFIKASYFEKECGDISKAIEKCCSLRIKNPNYRKDNCKMITKNIFDASKFISRKKVKPVSQNRNVHFSGDIVANTSETNTESAKMTESGDNNCDLDDKVYNFVKRYPNYLKSSSHISGSHFCLNKCKSKKKSFDDPAAHISNRYLIAPIKEGKSDTDNDENKSPKRVTYPNYLKFSSNFARKHFCVEIFGEVNDEEFNDGVKNSLQQTEDTGTSKDFSNDKCSSENPYSCLIKYPYQPRMLSKLKDNISYPKKRIKNMKSKSMCIIENSENSTDNYTKYIRDLKSQLEALKLENEQLKSKLESIECSQEETLKKYSEAQNEIKFLKYDNECQKKQIKYQKSHLKLLNMAQCNSVKKSNFSRKNLKQKESDKIFENREIENSNNADISDGKTKVKIAKTTPSLKRVQELEQQNKLMVQGLIELRDYLQRQSKSHFTEMEPLVFNNSGSFPEESSKIYTHFKIFHSTPTLNPDMCTTGKSENQLKEYSEMLRGMAKCNELMKKGENVKEKGPINPIKNDQSFQRPNLNCTNNETYQTTKNSLNEKLYGRINENYTNNPKSETRSDLFETFTLSSLGLSNNIQGTHEASSDTYSGNCCGISPKMNNNVIKYYNVNEMSFGSADFGATINCQTPTKGLNYSEEFNITSATFNELRSD